ncbi:MAG: sulfotransferase domain-containing protein [Sneathiella sp.]|nr:sulfotransferase domain-containing protein [Sneathiella sp.]
MLILPPKHDGLIFAETHNLFSTYFDIPLITPAVTQGAIYIIRNPLDVVISVSDHFGLEMDKAVDFVNNPNGSSAPTETMVRQIFSSWTKNVEHWTLNPTVSVLAVRYEDLHEHPA